MSSFNQSPSCLQLWARLISLPRSCLLCGWSKTPTWLILPPLSLMIPISVSQGWFFWGGAGGKLSSDEYSHDRVCAHEKGINHSKVDLWQLKVWGCYFLDEKIKNMSFGFLLWKKPDLLSLERLGQAMKRVQDKQCLGQVLCIRELALFLFLAADLQGFFKTCWY